jgi:hypothetical protein
VRENITQSQVNRYDLTVDQSGAAILAFPVWTGSGFNIYAYRMSPDGGMQWGVDGILLSDTTMTGAFFGFLYSGSRFLTAQS